MADDTKMQLPPGEEDAQLEAGASVEQLPAGEEMPALPEGYEVVVGNTSANLVEDAQQFGEELTSVRNLIQRYAQQMDDMKAQIKEVSDSLRNIFDNDTELQQLEEQAKTMTTDVKNKRQRVKESPEAVQLQMKIKEFKEEQKEISDTLTNHLLRYYQMTGSTVIEDESGDEREIRINAKLGGKKATS
jgi:methyl-accepting chemotaxis protein